MLELYKVDEFYPSKSGNYRFEKQEMIERNLHEGIKN